jgi:hypothetical protein
MTFTVKDTALWAVQIRHGNFQLTTFITTFWSYRDKHISAKLTLLMVLHKILPHIGLEIFKRTKMYFLKAKNCWHTPQQKHYSKQIFEKCLTAKPKDVRHT